MKVADVTPRNNYTGNDSVVDFAYGFAILDQDDIEVLLDGVVQTITTNYTVSGVGNEAGGTVTMVTAPATGVKVALLRKQPLEQQSSYIAAEEFPNTRVENDYSKVWMRLQQHAEWLGRCLALAKKSLLSTIDVDDPTDGKYMYYDSASDSFKWGTLSSAGTLPDPVTVAKGGTGATSAAAARTALGAASTSHKDTHKSGGTDELTATDVLEAPTKRLRETGGPTILAMGAVADGELLQRNGTGIIGAAASALLTTSSVIGLKGVNTPATPNTKYDISADYVALRNAGFTNVVSKVNTGTLTCDLGTSGAANGLDTGAQASSTWYHFYFIWNGSTLASLASLAAPLTGPTLPSGYTHWAYAGAVYSNASTQLLVTYMRGSKEFYRSAIAVVTSSAATGPTLINVSATIPPNALTVFGSLHSLTGVGGEIKSIQFVSGSDAVLDNDRSSLNLAYEVPNISQTIYMNDSGGHVKDVWVEGFSVPNGGE